MEINELKVLIFIKKKFIVLITNIDFIQKFKECKLFTALARKDEKL